MGKLILFSTRIALRAVHLCFLSMRVVISIDYDMFLSFVLLMAWHGRSLKVADWCIAIMCHNVMHCLAVDNNGVWPGLSWCGQ